MHRPRTAALAVAALTATAFAPTTAEQPGVALVEHTVDGVVVEVDLFAPSEGPTVLAIADEQWVDEHADLLSDGGRYAIARVELGCGDVAGPEDVAAITEVVRWVAGERRDDDGQAHGTTGDGIALVGAGIGGLQALHAAAAPIVAAHVDGLATEDAWTDPYDVSWLGGVARRQDPLAAGTTFPCPTDGATDGTRDEWWASRSALDVVEELDGPVYVGHRLDGAVPLRQSHALVEALRQHHGADDDVLRYVNQRAEEQFDSETRLRDFLRAVIDPVEEIRSETTQRLRSHASGYGRFGGADCLLLCASTGQSGSGGVLRRGAAEISLHLNRTFEQDLDCVPVCVPGPGTGEIGSLETVNRFEDPWAPVFTWVDAGADTEVVTHRDPLNDGSGNEFGDEALPGGHGYHSLAFRTEPLDAELGILGSVRLAGVFSTSSAGGTVTPILVAIDDEGRQRLLTRGAIDLDFAAGLDERAHTSGWKPATIVFDAIDAWLLPGERLEVVLQSQNVGSFAPGSPQGTVNVATGPVEGVTDAGSTLHLPVVAPYPGA